MLFGYTHFLERRTLSAELNVTCWVEVPLQGTRAGRRHPGAARRLPRAMVNRPVGPAFHKLPSGLWRIGARVFQPVPRTGMSVPLSFGHVVLACDAGHAASKPRRGGSSLAQGKRSAALGRDANIPWPEGPLQRNDLQRVQTLNDPSILPLQIMLIMSKKRIPPFHQKRMVFAPPVANRLPASGIPRLFKDRTDQTDRSDFQMASAQTIGLYRSRRFSMVPAYVVALIYEDRIGWQRFF